MENKTNQEIYNKLTAIESLLEGTHQVKPNSGIHWFNLQFL